MLISVIPPPLGRCRVRMGILRPNHDQVARPDAQAFAVDQVIPRTFLDPEQFRIVVGMEREILPGDDIDAGQVERFARMKEAG